MGLKLEVNMKKSLAQNQVIKAPHLQIYRGWLQHASVLAVIMN